MPMGINQKIMVQNQNSNLIMRPIAKKPATSSRNYRVANGKLLLNKN